MGDFGGNMTFHKLVLAVVASTPLMLADARAATYTYVGSWQVDEGPYWGSGGATGPLAYTAQEAAALLFGGTAADYVISTVSALVSEINFMAWYSVIGYGGNQDNGGSLLAQDYVSKYLGLYYGPVSGYPMGDENAPASAYVLDNASGAEFVNYAFRVSAVPGPLAGAGLPAVLGLIGFAAWRRQRRQPA